VVTLHNPEHAPTGEEIAFLSELAAQLAIAVGNARVYSEAMREKVENQLLLELGTKISSSLDSSQLLEQILDLVFQVVRYDAAGIYLVDKKTNWITRSAGTSPIGMTRCGSRWGKGSSAGSPRPGAASSYRT
jgi:GAF domain-containing protein